MGSEDILQCENHFQAAQRPEDVCQSPCSRSKVDEKDIKGLLSSRYYNLRKLDGAYRELRLSNSTSPHRKSMPARPHGSKAKNSEAIKRGSVYQSSRDRNMRKLREGRRNVKPTLTDDAFLSFEIVDSSPHSSSNEPIELSRQKRSPLVSLSAESTHSTVGKHSACTEKSVEFLELSFCDLPEERLMLNQEGKGSVEEKSIRNKMSSAEADRIILSEADRSHNLPKSLSAKAVMSNSTCPAERESFKSSPKSRFSPFKKMLDPIMKSKSMRNPSFIKTETVGGISVNPLSVRRHRMLRKSLLNDFSKVTDKIDCDDEFFKREKVSMAVSSPAHLHASLKLDCKDGAPSYEFAVKDPEDVLLAKTWRTDSAFNWVYTFHSCKKKINNIVWGSKDTHRQSPLIIGQMQVSCYLCSQMNASGSLESSTVTEFILYDVAQARRSFAIEGHCRPSDSNKPQNFTIGETLVTECPSEGNGPETEKLQNRSRRPSIDFDTDPSTSYPLSPADLHVNLEIAATVIQIPFSKKQLQTEEEQSSEKHQDLSNASASDEGTNTTFACMNRANLKVVTPSGRHGLPNTEEDNPSSLLDRWRFGGGCDCAGWDMGCPLVVFDNACFGDVTDCSGVRSLQQMLLFVQGKKDKMPALSIVAEGNGQYSVDFHAQLSALQAFSICISILHTSEAASALCGEKSRQMLYSSSLKALLEEEVRLLMEAVAQEEKRKAKKSGERVPRSFILDSPFSPMGRV